MILNRIAIVDFVDNAFVYLLDNYATCNSIGEMELEFINSTRTILHPDMQHECELPLTKYI